MLSTANVCLINQASTYNNWFLIIMLHAISTDIILPISKLSNYDCLRNHHEIILICPLLTKYEKKGQAHFKTCYLKKEHVTSENISDGWSLNVVVSLFESMQSNTFEFVFRKGCVMFEKYTIEWLVLLSNAFETKSIRPDIYLVSLDTKYLFSNPNRKVQNLER